LRQSERPAIMQAGIHTLRKKADTEPASQKEKQRDKVSYIQPAIHTFKHTFIQTNMHRYIYTYGQIH